MAPLVAQLIQEAQRIGYDVAVDEWTQRQGAGHMLKSLHYIGLAVDLLLYRSGTYLQSSEDYRALGEFWEGLHPLCRWGGRFRNNAGDPRPDGGHFSISWDGRA
jgi:hypothetical protein